MDFLSIGKPAINIYLPLQEFPQEGDIFTIKKKNESLGNIAATSACILGKWGMKSHFTGVVGSDAYADKIRQTFAEYNVETRYIEQDYQKGTCVNYNILNTKDGQLSRILYNDPEHQLQRFKYDFIPNFAVIDGTDLAGALALINNNSQCKTIFYGRVADKDSVSMSKRCTYTVCSESFALGLTRIENASSAADYVNMYQKIVDLVGSSNYIVVLNNHKILYSVDGKVKMLPEMKINIVDASSFNSIFTGSFAFSIANNMHIDDAVKFANTAAAISMSKIGEVPSIPEIDEVLDNSGLREKLGYARAKQTSPVAAEEVKPLQVNNTLEQANSVPNQAVATPVVNNQTPVPPINHNTPLEPQNQTIVNQALTSDNIQTNPQGAAVYQTPVQTINQQVNVPEGNIYDNNQQ